MRFVPVGGDDQIQYGEPIVSSSEDLDEKIQTGKLEVHVCEGTDPLSAKPTEKLQAVKKLLGPLRPEDVPIIRCIGLNYKTHSN